VQGSRNPNICFRHHAHGLTPTLHLPKKGKEINKAALTVLLAPQTLEKAPPSNFEGLRYQNEGHIRV
jgi:hypothetical protein